ncbi:histidine phosphatase family protein [Nonomuraea sp. NPDC003709]|uniref:histidine phosphatase family protein n=1 Tax=Nonomuraea sp. NPDC003709 TaxID=3154450 RepID=UPI0033B59E9B
MAVTLGYETHSIAVDNETGIATGWLPRELSARGRGLAVELGAAVDVVCASDLGRAVQTAGIGFAGGRKEIRFDRRLRECDYGIYNGRPVGEVAASRSRHIDMPWPGGQSYRRVVAEMVGFLRDMMDEWQGGLVLVVSHSANRWALQNLLDGTPLEELVDVPFEWRPGWEFSIA